MSNETVQAVNENAEKPEYVNIKFPRGFAHPYTFTDKNGHEWDKAIVNIPPNTNLNGIDLTGFSVDVFLSDWQISQIANGDGLTCGFAEDKPIELFKGEGDERKTLEIKPWNLTKAIKEQREAYAAEKAAEKETSFADRAKDAQSVSGVDRGNRDAPMKAMNER